MRIRTIKPEFFTHDGLYDLEQKYKLPLRISFVGIWCFCDREGRFKWKPRQMKPCILPHDDVDFEKVLNALESGGFICRYESGGEDYGFVPSFLRHQIINNREMASQLPEPPKDNPRVKDASKTPLVQVQGKGREGKGKDIVASPRERNPLFDTLAESCNMNPSQLTGTEGGRIGKALADIKKASPHVTPEEIRSRAAKYAEVMPKGSLLTPTALAGNWTLCSGAIKKTGMAEWEGEGWKKSL